MLAMTLHSFPEGMAVGVSFRLQGNPALRQELDLDSMDFLNFIISLHGSTGVDIPETDYMQLGTIEDAVQYIEQKLRGDETGLLARLKHS